MELLINNISEEDFEAAISICKENYKDGFAFNIDLGVRNIPECLAGQRLFIDYCLSNEGTALHTIASWSSDSFVSIKTYLKNGSVHADIEHSASLSPLEGRAVGSYIAEKCCDHVDERLKAKNDLKENQEKSIEKYGKGFTIRYSLNVIYIKPFGAIPHYADPAQSDECFQLGIDRNCFSEEHVEISKKRNRKAFIGRWTKK